MKINVKKILKRTFIGLGVTLLLIILAAILIPYFFKDQILAYAKTKINESVNAKVDFKDASLSMIWTFPNLKFSLKGLTVDGNGTFEGVRLADMESLDFTLDLWSVWYMETQPLEVKRFALQKPNLNIIILPDGQANYDIAIPSDEKKEETSSESSDFKLKLSKYGIYNANVIYDDRQGGTYANLQNFTHEGSGNFTTSVYDLSTNTTCDAMTVAYGAVSYLNKVKLDADMTLGMDMNSMTFTFKDNSIALNDLGLKFDGKVAMPANDINLDLTFASTKTTFASVLSLIPAAYTADYKDVKTNGTASLSGFVKGIYNDNSMPAFKADLDVQNANFQYPSLPMGVDDIVAKISVNSPATDLDRMTVDISKFHFRLGSNPFDAMLLLKTPISDPDINARLNGTLNLADLSKAFPMEGVKELTGLLKTDLKCITRLSSVTNEQYEKVDMSGKFVLSNSRYVADGTPVVQINEVNLDFAPNACKLNNLDLRLGKSDVRAVGTLDNLLAYYSGTKAVKGNVTMTSNLFDANEWTSSEATATTGTTASSSTSTAPVNTAAANSKLVTNPYSGYDRFDLTGDVSFNKILYGDYTLLNTKAKGHFTPSKASMENFQVLIGNSDVQADGELNGWWDYLFVGTGTLKGKFNLNSRLLDLNQFMSASPTTTTTATNGSTTATTSTTSAPATAESSVLLVPKDIDVIATAKIGQLRYSTYQINEATGEIIVRDQKVNLSGLHGKTLGGEFALSGTYDTKDAAKPKFALTFDVQKMSFQETAQKALTMKSIAPIIQYLQGLFNTHFSMSANLKPDLMPDLASLTADGKFETFDAILRNFKPLKDLSAKTGIKDLDDLKLKNTTNFFEIKDGKFQLKQPLMSYKFNDVTMVLGGNHAIGGDMNYDMDFEVPSSKFSGSTAGAGATQFLGSLSSQAQSKGLNIKPADVIQFTVGVTGSIADPKFNIKFKQLGKGLIDNLAQQAADKAKEEAEKHLKELEDKAKAEADKFKADAEARLKAESDKIKAEADKKAKELADKAKAEAARLKAEAEKALKDKANGVINQLPNPFKKH